MPKSELQKMTEGEWYTCLDDEQERLRNVARSAVHQHNTLLPDKRGCMGPELSALLNAPDAFIEAPFHCAYGFNISLGTNVYLNAGCTILDTASVTIG